MVGAAPLPVTTQATQATNESTTPPSPPDRPFLGAFIKNTDDEQSQALGVTATVGAVVTRTTATSPARAAGLLPGDVITSLDDQPINDAMSFYRTFARCQPNQQIELKVLRATETLNVSVVLTSQKSPAVVAPPSSPTAPVPEVSPPAANATLIYEHPQAVFRFTLPAGWKVVYGQRGQLRHTDYDTLEDPSGAYSLICPHQPLPSVTGVEGLSLFRQQQLAALTTHDDVQATGYSVAGQSWVEIRYRLPESQQWVARLATNAADGRCYYFVFVAAPQVEPTQFAVTLSASLKTVAFTGTGTAPPTGTEPTRVAPTAVIPASAVRLPDRLQRQSRVVGLSAVSGGHPKAVALGIETPAGAVVTEVYANSPAAAVGLQPKDVIVQFGEHEIQTLEDCQAAIWTSPIDSVQLVTVVRGLQRLTFQLRIAPDTTQRLAIQQYRHSLGGYRFDYLPRWTLLPTARREEGTDRLYDVLESEYGGYLMHLFRDRESVADPVTALHAFRDKVSADFLTSQEGWAIVNDTPLVYVSGTVGRDRLFTLYRIAFVMQNHRYEINVYSPPLNDPATLPLVLQAVVGSLRE